MVNRLKDIEAWMERFYPEHLDRRDDAAVERARLTVAFSMALTLWVPIYIVLVGVGFGELLLASLIAPAGLGIAATPWVLKRLGARVASHSICASLFGIVLLFSALTGAFESPTLVVLVIVPVFAVSLGGWRAGGLWAALASISAVGLYALSVGDIELPQYMSENHRSLMSVGVMVTVVLLLLSLAGLSDRLKVRALSRLQVREASHKAVVQSAADAIITVERDRVASANRAAVELFGWEERELLGKPFSALIVLEDDERADLEGLLGVDRSCVGLRWDGVRFPMGLSMARTDTDESGRSYVAVLRDRSLAEQARSAIEEARDKALAAASAKSNFLANMSHELRTPLNAILGYTQMLIEDASDDSPELPDLERIEKASQHLLALIEDLLDLNRIESGMMALSSEPIDVRALVQELIAEVEPAAASRGNQLASVVLTQSPELYSDRLRVRQILLHLLSNAAKFTKDGEITISVERLEPDGPWVFRVRDTGLGIAPDKLERIFMAFEQADNSSTREHDGAGMGLAISHRLATLLKGRLEVESAPGAGATFSLHLPHSLDT